MKQVVPELESSVKGSNPFVAAPDKTTPSIPEVTTVPVIVFGPKAIVKLDPGTKGNPGRIPKGIRRVPSAPIVGIVPVAPVTVTQLVVRVLTQIVDKSPAGVTGRVWFETALLKTNLTPSYEEIRPVITNVPIVTVVSAPMTTGKPAERFAIGMVIVLEIPLIFTGKHDRLSLPKDRSGNYIPELFQCKLHQSVETGFEFQGQVDSDQ